jgi:hypothetical protein
MYDGNPWRWRLPEFPKDDEFESLWKGYFAYVANMAWLNPKVQLQNVPLRYRNS